MRGARGWYDPRLYGPISRRLAAIERASVPLSIAVGAISPVAFLMRRSLILASSLALTALILAFLPRIVVRIESQLAASGLEAELPAAIALLIPYVASSRDLANLLIYAARELRLRFLGREAWRLSALLSSGMDERAALRFLADTTPSQRLRTVIRELLSAEELGVSRSRLVAAMYSRALDMARTAWSGYVKVGEVVVEGVITLVASIAVLVPLAAFGGLQVMPVLAAMAVALSVGSAIALIVMRPTLGDVEGGWCVGAASLAAVILSSILASRGSIPLAIAVLLPASIYAEIQGVRAERLAEQAIAWLREAASRARLGLPFEDQLRQAAPAGGRLVRAAAAAYRIAGRVGLGGAIESFADLVAEALRSVRATRLEGMVLEAISAAVPAVSAVALKLMASYVASTPFMGALGLTSLSGSMGVLAFMAPLAPLPAAALQRGRRLSPAFSLLSVLALAIALRLA